jgi:pyruvate dehydrogenase phosphatase
MYLFGVFDGHGGPWCSDVIGQRLFEYIAVSLHAPSNLEVIMRTARNMIGNRVNPSLSSSSSIAALLLHSYYNPYKDTRNSKIKEIHQVNLLKHIEEVYTAFDSDNTDIASGLESAFVKLDRDMQICTAGSCACVALVKDSDLYIANCGDARAVLGRSTAQHEHSYRIRSI